MPNSINIPTPRVLAGDAEAKISQMHSYLFQLAEQLALILNSIAAGAGAMQPLAQSSSADVYGMQSALKQQIVDTAAALRQEMGSGDAALQGNINSLSSSVNTIQGNVSTLQGNVSSLQSSVSTIQGDVDTLEGSVSSLQGSVSALQGNVSNLQSSVSTIQGNVSSLQSSVSALNQTADDLQDDIDAISLASLGLRRGIATTTSAIKGGEYADIAVTFAALGSTPVVVAGLIGGGGDGEYGGNVSCRVLTGTITTTGFTARVTSSTGQETAQSYSVAWIAAG